MKSLWWWLCRAMVLSWVVTIFLMSIRLYVTEPGADRDPLNPYSKRSRRGSGSTRAENIVPIKQSASSKDQHRMSPSVAASMAASLDVPPPNFSLRSMANSSPLIEPGSGVSSDGAVRVQVAGTEPTADKSNQKSVVILLQRSPVRQQNQGSRLSVIDHGWATWTTKPTSKTQIYATLPSSCDTKGSFDCFGARGLSLKNVKTLVLKSFGKAKPASGLPVDAFQNIVNSFTHLLVDESNSQLKWLVYANDHSFFVPSNLEKFLSSLNENDLIYTGNKLQLSLGNNKVIWFASGGAGAVLSHASLKLLLTVWAIMRCEELHSVLPYILDNMGVPYVDWSHQYNSSIFPTLCSVQLKDTMRESNVIDIEKSGFSIICFLMYIKAWSSAVISGDMGPIGGQGPLNDQLDIRISSHVKVSVRAKTTASKERQTKTNSNNSHKRNLLKWEPSITLVRSLGGVTEEEKRVSSTAATEESPFSSSSSSSLSSSSLSSITIEFASLKSSCGSSSTWTLQNPGIVIVTCLQKQFSIPFTESTSEYAVNYLVPAPSADSSSSSGGHKSGSTTSGSADNGGDLGRQGERFNAYGLVRTLFGDMDEWYVDCKSEVAYGKTLKQLLVSQQHQQSSSSIGKNSSFASVPVLTERQFRNRIATIALDVVSFHYVSERESQLLYTLLDSGVAAIAPSVNDLFSMWPKGNLSVLGDYARALKDTEEARVLHKFLSTVLV